MIRLFVQYSSAVRELVLTPSTSVAFIGRVALSLHFTIARKSMGQLVLGSFPQLVDTR